MTQMMETYYGYVRTPADAIKLFEACRMGMLPRVQRRLSEKERQNIRSGSVFVWDEREAGMRRWTDGKSWSASRVSGSFLTYREMEGKRGGSGFGGGRRVGAGKTPDSGRGSDEDQEDAEPDGYRYKVGGLMKQSFSITTTGGQHLHLISYFTRDMGDQLVQPVNDPNLRHIIPPKGMYPESSLNEGASSVGRAPAHQQPPPYGHPPPQGYPPQYPGHPHPHPYWPPSPVATPPYSHSQYPPAPYQQQPPLPPPGHHYPGHPQPHAPYPQPPHHPQYERSPLPPPHPSAAAPPPPSSRQPMPPLPLQRDHYQPPVHHSQPRSHSPHATQPVRMAPISLEHKQHLQAQAREAVVQVEPHLASGPLPSLVSSHHPENGGALPSQTPPSRALSVSPPRSSHSESRGPSSNNNASTKASLSALLLPTTSEPSSASPGGGNSSAGGSPRTLGSAGAVATAAAATAASDEMFRTKGMLDKNFSRQ